MPQAGVLVQIDGSPHDRLEGRGPRLTLVGAIDDATGAIVAATFAPVEDGRAYLTILKRMCRELGISSIPAASAQAKGRVERLWGTCQDRLVSELRLAGADDEASANAVLERFIGRFNASFAVPPSIATPAWRPAPATPELERICAFRWRRVVGNDNTIRVEGAVLQLPATHGGRGLAGRRVEVELRLDGRLLVTDHGRTLLAVPVSPDLRELRSVRLAAPGGPKPATGGAERPGYPPRPDHPWNRPGPNAPSRRGLTESLSR
jgi:hypothetical protein